MKHTQTCEAACCSAVQLLDAEEERIWRERQEAAYKEADASREEFREQFEVSRGRALSNTEPRKLSVW